MAALVQDLGGLGGGGEVRGAEGDERLVPLPHLRDGARRPQAPRGEGARPGYDWQLCTCGLSLTCSIFSLTRNRTPSDVVTHRQHVAVRSIPSPLAQATRVTEKIFAGHSKV